MPVWLLVAVAAGGGWYAARVTGAGKTAAASETPATIETIAVPEPPVRPAAAERRADPDSSEPAKTLLFRHKRQHFARDWNPKYERALTPEEEASLTPLVAAVNLGKREAIRAAIAAGSDVNASWNGWRPIHITLEEFHGTRGVADELLAAGADRDILVSAAVGSEEDLRKALEDTGSWNLRTPLKKSALHLAVHYRREWAVRMLLAAGFPVDPVDQFDMTPLSWSFQVPEQGLARALIEGGADVGHSDRNRQTPLYYAASYNKPDLVRLLIDRGADPNVPGQQGTPLHMAALYGREEVARILVEKGANTGLKDSFGRTPRESALKHGKNGVADLLVGL